MADDRDDLQFDTAETPVAGTDAGPVCVACQRPIADAYWEINGQVACTSCKELLEAARTGGSGLRRFLRASAFGFLAGAIGTAIYYAILKLTGYEFSLVAIVVGFMVGAAVRNGSDHRGGWFYQLLAVFLTYAAIVSTYIPFIVEGFREEFKHGQQETAAVSPQPPTGPETPSEAPAATPPANEQGGPDYGEMTAGQVVGMGLLAYVVLFVLACVAPFLGGAQNLLGLLIILFGLYQAWSINRRPVIRITGPHLLSAEPPLPEPEIPDLPEAPLHEG